MAAPLTASPPRAFALDGLSSDESDGAPPPAETAPRATFDGVADGCGWSASVAQFDDALCRVQAQVGACGVGGRGRGVAGPGGV
jgi:hypothetical protein